MPKAPDAAALAAQAEATQRQEAEAAAALAAQRSTKPPVDADEDEEEDDSVTNVVEMWKSKAIKRLAEKRRVAIERDALKAELATGQTTIATLTAQIKADEPIRAKAADAVLREAIGNSETKVRDPKVALRLIDREAITYGADGTPTNLDEILTALIEEYPGQAGDDDGEIIEEQQLGSIGATDRRTIRESDLVNLKGPALLKALKQLGGTNR